MMHWKKRQLINELIEKAVREEINLAGFQNPDHIKSLQFLKNSIAEGVGPRITEDIGRARRLVQLCKFKGGK